MSKTHHTHDADELQKAYSNHHHHRLLRPDGTFNVDVRGLPWFRPSEIYQNLIQMSWLRFNLIVIASYIVVNSFFALIYYFIGTENLTSTTSGSVWHEFLDAFFFSAQSLTTVGYGRVAPLGVAVSSVAAFESLVGLMGFALATGLLYGRFSRPNAKLVHSRNVIISPYKSGKALMFRIANQRKSQLVNVDVRVTYKRNVVEGGREVRHFTPLHIENPHMNMFPLSWTVIHAITESSPLFGKTIEDLEKEDFELLVYFSGYDESFSNNVHARVSYKVHEVVWGARFLPDFIDHMDRPTVHDLNKINDYEPAELSD
jgi:inward rectifier potassium channel